MKAMGFIVLLFLAAGNIFSQNYGNEDYGNGNGKIIERSSFENGKVIIRYHEQRLQNLIRGSTPVYETYRNSDRAFFSLQYGEYITITETAYMLSSAGVIFRVG